MWAVEKFPIVFGNWREAPAAWAIELKHKLNLTSKHKFFIIIFRRDTESPERWQFNAKVDTLHVHLSHERQTSTGR